jgi:type I restriction enzyme M protein
VETYRDRLTEDKYSRNVPLSEIVGNDYNLNISRYVTTFEEEETVDLGTVTKKLEKLREQGAGYDATIRNFCNELQIQSPV